MLAIDISFTNYYYKHVQFSSYEIAQKWPVVASAMRNQLNIMVIHREAGYINDEKQ